MPIQELILSPPAQHLLEPVGTGTHREQHSAGTADTSPGQEGQETNSKQLWQMAVHFPTHRDGLVSQPGIQATLQFLLVNFRVFPPSSEFSVIHKSSHMYLNISTKSDG